VDIAKTQANIIAAFDRVAARCEEFVAVSWLAGEGKKFDSPVRRFGDKVRPSALVLEVTRHAGLNLSAAMALADRAGNVWLETLGKWDFRAPISPKGFGSQLNMTKQKHRLNAKRGCEECLTVKDRPSRISTTFFGSNLSKLDDTGRPIRNEDGKVLKGPNYKPPVLDDLVA